MFAVILLLLVAVPLAELFVIIEVWTRIGGIETIALLLVVSVVGAWLVKKEGLSVWLRLNEQLARGAVPTNELIDGALILFAGALMLTPGFLTDAVGLLLLFPPTRAGLRSLLKKRFAGRIDVYSRAGGIRFTGVTSAAGYRVYEPGMVVDADEVERSPETDPPE